MALQTFETRQWNRLKVGDTTKQTIQVFSPKNMTWSRLEIINVLKKFETQNFGWAVVTKSNGDSAIVCLG